MNNAVSSNESAYSALISPLAYSWGMMVSSSTILSGCGRVGPLSDLLTTCAPSLKMGDLALAHNIAI